MVSIKKYIAAAVVCGALISVWYVVSPTEQAVRKKTHVARKAIRQDSFADYLNHKIASIARVDNSTPRKVIYDNDAAKDDALALVLIGNDPGIDLQAITVNGTGEAHGKVGARNMASIAMMMGKTQVPVAYGRSEPLSSAGQPFPDRQRLSTDNMLQGAGLPLADESTIKNNAVELIKNVVSASNDKVTILATGPLTNIAEFIQKYPQLKNRIEKIVVMGGAVNVPGNIQGLVPSSSNNVSEWNFYADPKAVQVVMQSGIPMTLVALDASNQVPLTQDFFEATGVEDQSDLKLVHHLLNIYVADAGDKAFHGLIYAWDELAAMVMLDPSIAQTESMPLKVDVTNGNVKVAKNGESSGKVDVVTKIIHPDTFLRNYTAMVKSNHLFVQRKYPQDATQYRADHDKQENSNA